MNIPENVQMRNTLHGSGAKGMALYGYEDTAGLGVRMEARRKDGRSPFVETWFLDALPGQEFKSFAELRAKALPLTDEQIAAETLDKYPLIKDAGPDTCGNACRLCPRTGTLFNRSGERVKHDTWRVTLAYSWKDCTSLSLCDEHMNQYEADPKGLSAAVDAEVAARKARAEAYKLARAANPITSQGTEPTTPERT